MSQEIERKFLVKGEFKNFAKAYVQIVQAYLSLHPARIVRVRKVDNRAFLTIKGDLGDLSVVRQEYEYEIPLSDAQGLMALALPHQISKRRYFVPEENGLIFEVDVFFGRNNGLVLAEIELPDEAFAFAKPDWLGREVTANPFYYNHNLLEYPYSQWTEQERNS